MILTKLRHAARLLPVGLCALFITNGNTVCAQTPVKTWVYSPDTKAQVDSIWWNPNSGLASAGWWFPAYTQYWTNPWSVRNNAGGRVDGNGYPMPMQLTYNWYNDQPGHWNVLFDIGARITDSTSPYYFPPVVTNGVVTKTYGGDLINAYPSLSWTAQKVRQDEISWRNLVVDWTYGASVLNTGQWAKTSFTAMIEVRCRRYSDAALTTEVPGSRFIFQIVVMECNYGTNLSGSTVIDNKTFSLGEFGAEGVRVRNFYINGRYVNKAVTSTGNVRNTFDVLQFLQYLKDTGWNNGIVKSDTYIYAVNAGVELNLGAIDPVSQTPASKFYSAKYGVTYGVK